MGPPKVSLLAHGKEEAETETVQLKGGASRKREADSCAGPCYRRRN